ncbi:MAG: aldehyde ferredoxin oxidoreductase C-terminal domain-containing protein, partial [Natronomonas sp.]|uniref:aldehyde ferredoxin oxidoreductase C-terminal domain-containing protein n=1 Tax=Natronomonas sp. TaxID=2184060 RepID=UPI00286FBD96
RAGWAAAPAGGRTVTLERHFNNERDFDGADDRLPYADQLPGLDETISEYYELREWNSDGTVPSGTVLA